MKLFARGDADGFCAIALDNLVQLLLVPALCIGVVGLRPELVYGRILPGIAVSYLVGNLFYAWQAHRLARAEGRDDVCALPFGLNTPTFVAYVFLVILPAKQLALSQHQPDPDRIAWEAGLVACLGSGIIEFLGAFVGEALRRATPRAALLASLSGAGLAFLTLNFLFLTFSHPFIGLTTLGLVLLFYFGGLKPRGGVPAALVVVGVGTAIAWATRLAPVGPAPWQSLGWRLPPATVPALWHGLRAGELLPYISVIVPMGLLNLLASLQCVESAAAAGDSYSVKSSLMVNGLGTLAAACFGSPFPTSIYIGHPAWKKMGARAGYSTANGIFVTLVCLTGSVALIGWAIPAETGIAIIIWVGIIIAVQAFEASPQRHWPAVVIGITPVVLGWATFLAKNALQLVGFGNVGSPGWTPAVVQTFQAGGLAIDGGFAVQQGTFYCAMILAAMTVFIIERRLVVAAAWAFAAALLSLLGLMHAWKFAGADTAGSLPLLERLAGGHPTDPRLFPAATAAAGYATLGVILLLARWFTRPEESA